MRRLAGFFVLSVLGVALCAQDAALRGEEAVAERYASYARQAASDGRWSEAEEVLARAADYASVSSDVSFLLAHARRRLGRSVSSVLDAVRLSLATSRWRAYSPEEALLLEAECLLDLRRFDESLSVLSNAVSGADADLLRLRAIAGTGDRMRFFRYAVDALASYPRDPRFAAVLFRNAGEFVESEAEGRLVSTVLSRLPFLLETDPFLAVLAAPFIIDQAERIRLISAYRASGGRAVESLPLALMLGTVHEEDAVAELFSHGRLDRAILDETFGLMRTEENRLLFIDAFARYSGEVAGDVDRDAVPETVAAYENGEIREFMYDPDQDGLPEWRLRFADGLPSSADIVLSAEPGPGGAGIPARPTSLSDRETAIVAWERYPYVSAVAVGIRTFGFPPSGFPFSPVRLVPLVPGASTRIPSVDTVAPRLTERTLYSFASWMERPGALAIGSNERIYFSEGSPLRSQETVDDTILALTYYQNGYPVLRRMDLDLDGRIETVERFKAGSSESASVETDFDGDGIFEKEHAN